MIAMPPCGLDRSQRPFSTAARSSDSDRESWGRAISDYDAALKGNPKSAMSLYGRGLVKLRDGKRPEGENDLAAAKAIAPEVADEFTKMGLTP